MTKISLMYKWSGGTDYRNLCAECKHCVKEKRGSSIVDKCRIYGTEGRETDWNRANIACKYFNGPAVKIPVIVQMSEKRKTKGEIEGQMDIMDFLGG